MTSLPALKQLTSDPTKPSIPNQNVPFTIGHIHLVEGAYTLEDPREPFMHNRASFDYNHFTLQHLTAEVSDFLVLGDTIAFDAKGLSGIDRDSRIKIRQLDTHFLYCNTKMELGRLYAHIGNSIIRNELIFSYDKPSAFGDFNSRVRSAGQLPQQQSRVERPGLFLGLPAGPERNLVAERHFYRYSQRLSASAHRSAVWARMAAAG